MAANKTKDVKELSVEEKLKALYELQLIVSEIDRIKTLRGELPLEVQDLEDEVAGMETRLEKYSLDIEELGKQISDKKIEIKNSQDLIAKYTSQQDNVRNNREYDFLTKEIEFQTLEIELSEKKIKEFAVSLQQKEVEIEQIKTRLEEKNEDLKVKRDELEDIVAETKQDEERLRMKAKKLEGVIEARLLTAFKRIRKSARNGLTVVTIQRDACGGCFNKIPPQKQLDVKNRKKIIVCEYCGRIMIDPDLAPTKKSK